MKKQLSTFLLREDEDALSVALRAARPTILFVDDSVWPSTIPPAHDSIVGCSSPLVFIWDREMFPKLPSRERPDGRFDGPSSGVVFQVCRSLLKENILLSGRVAIGWENASDEFQQLVKVVFSALRKLTRAAVWDANGKDDPQYRVGLAASRWRQAQGNVFCDHATRYILT